MLSDKIININNDIAKLSTKNINPILINKEFNRLTEQIKDCKNILNNVTNKIDEILNLKSNESSSILIDDETFEKYSKDIEESYKIIENEDLENQIKTFELIIKKINLCDFYLTNKKKEIIYCDDNLN